MTKTYITLSTLVILAIPLLLTYHNLSYSRIPIVPVPVGEFSHMDLMHWKSKSFAGETRNAIEKDAREYSLYADSRQAASVLYRNIRIDLCETPFLN